MILRKLKILRRSQESDIWPVALLLFAVLVPAVCLLWFMGAAMRNERLAARQKLAEAYRVQLSTAQARLQQHWAEAAAELEKVAASEPAPAAFLKCVRSGMVDSAVIFDEAGQILYPSVPRAIQSDFGGLEAKWREAGRLEEQRQYLEAAARYEALAREVLDTTNASARGVQAQARCLLQAGHKDAVIDLVNDAFSSERYRHAADLQGRLIAANAELMALELITNRDSLDFQSIGRRLAARLMDYENAVLAAPQRQFVMKEVQRLSRNSIGFPTLAAEQLAAEVSESDPKLLSTQMQPQDQFSLSPQRAESRSEGRETAKPFSVDGKRKFALQRGPLPDLWQFTTPNQRVLALTRADKLLAAAKTAMTSNPYPADVNVTLLPPDVEAADALLTVPAGEPMPGWRLALSIKDREFWEATAGRRTAVYLWTAVLVVAGIGVLALTAARVLRRQMTLARLKNDLAATVSHELKTPLASMRVLVESLLDSEAFDEQKTREYLQLINQENERLGRLIQNFLNFSRMERRRHAFQFSLLAPDQIVDAALASGRGRLDLQGGRLEVEVEDDLPPVVADLEALATALLNLLDNAYKYSEETRHIILRARAENGRVKFSVSDNGIGIAACQQRRIFQPFYQVDQRLARKEGGCGLGLSIVRLIVKAHHGCVSVESRPGGGSTFIIALPAASDAGRTGKEALA